MCFLGLWELNKANKILTNELGTQHLIFDFPCKGVEMGSKTLGGLRDQRLLFGCGVLSWHLALFSLFFVFEFGVERKRSLLFPHHPLPSSLLPALPLSPASPSPDELSSEEVERLLGDGRTVKHLRKWREE